MWRLIGILVTVVFAIASAILTWPQFFRVDHYIPIAQLVALRGPVTAGFLVIFVLALIATSARKLRGFFASLAIVALLAAVANAGILAYRGLGADSLTSGPDQTEDSIRIMTWNTAGWETDPETIAQLAAEYDVDVIALPETTIETGEAVAILMREAGSPMWAWHEQYPGADAYSTTLLISPDLGDYAVVESTADGVSNTSTAASVVAMPISGDGPTIVAVNAVAPRADTMDQWREDLQWVANQCAADNVILAGDFNATVDHMTRYATGGDLGDCVDAARLTGNGAVGTWPVDVPTLLGAPIDHVMATEYWHADGSVVLTDLEDSASDHRPLIVQYTPAG